MRPFRILFIILLLSSILCPSLFAQEEKHILFDDKMLLDGYAEEYGSEPKEFLIGMIKDDTLPSPYKMAAAVRVFRENFAQEIYGKEKILAIKALLRRFSRSDSSFVKIEVMYTLCQLDRYRYFKSMIPLLIQKLDHYNKTVNEIAFDAINDIIKTENQRPREARIVFNALRKMLFLSRNRLKNIKEPGPKLKRKLELVRWAIKILGNRELKRLPSEVIHLL